ncbi:MAG TPA: Ku protein [Gemmatimonadales bacterium]|nr:Ku protein [Gemmatimonadales bacterium]
MSARPISSATISFGLVSVPIQMYSASESQASVSFNWINKKTGARCKQQYVDAKTGDKVEKEDMIKGYEFSKGQYVTFTPDEIKALEEKATGSIDITEFVPADQIDRLYFDKAYFLGPNKGGERAYRLLAEALKQTGLAAIGQYAARGKQYLVMLRPMDGGLVMETLHYADEVRSIKDVPIPEGEVKPAELALALQLIEQAKSEKFRPEAYEDTVRKRMLEQIERKVQGQEIVAEPTEAPEAQIIDLMEALKASLAKGGLKGAAGERKPARRAERAAKAEAEKPVKVKALKLRKKTA